MIFLELALSIEGQTVGFGKPTARGTTFIGKALTRAGVKHPGVDSIARELSRWRAKERAPRQPARSPKGATVV